MRDRVEAIRSAARKLAQWERAKVIFAQAALARTSFWLAWWPPTRSIGLGSWRSTWTNTWGSTPITLLPSGGTSKSIYSVWSGWDQTACG